MVDAEVLAVRRARRAEMAERAQAQRAKEAEARLAALGSEVEGLELRLAQAIDSRRRAEGELAALKRELRGPAHADILRGLAEAQARTEGLAADLVQARGLHDEAIHAAGTAAAACRRARAERDGLRQAGARAREGAAALARELADERATRRAIEEELEAERRRGAAHHRAALAAAAGGRRRQAQAQTLLGAATGDVRDALLAAEARVAEAERNVSTARLTANPAHPGSGAEGGDQLRTPAPADPAADRGDWLRTALRGLAADSPSTALRLIEGILPACLEPVTGILPCELELGDTVLALSPPGGARPAVERVAAPRGDARVRVALDVETLAALLTGERPRTLIRRRGPARVLAGGRRRARRLGGLAEAPIGLGALQRAGVYLDPGLAYAAIAQAVGRAGADELVLCVGQEVLDDPSGPWYVTVGGGERPRVSRERPAHLDAVVRTTRGAFLALLAGEPPPDGAKPAVRGDLRAVAALRGLADRAQGLR